MISSIALLELGLSSGIKAINVLVQETLLTVRFYTTDFGVAAQRDLAEQQAQLEATQLEAVLVVRADYNRHHAVRHHAVRHQTVKR